MDAFIVISCNYLIYTFSCFHSYPVSRGFSLAWLLVFTKSLTSLVSCIEGLFTPWETDR